MNLTTKEFKEKIYNYDQNKDKFVFEGNKVTVIDFYADWCQPCKILSPILDELDKEYDNVDFFKVDTESESELSFVFGIRSIPTLLFIPIEGKPIMTMGVLPKEQLKEIIDGLIDGKDFEADAKAEELEAEEVVESEMQEIEKSRS